MAWTIEFAPEARQALRKIDRQAAQRIVRFLNERVAPAVDPRSLGKPLHGQRHQDIWRYRVGDYRVLVRIKFQVITVQVVQIGHRREIYR